MTEADRFCDRPFFVRGEGELWTLATDRIDGLEVRRTLGQSDGLEVRRTVERGYFAR